ncbi:MAG: HAMP domain-containing sensor histidine kinase [Alcaligenaceae bacterium]
MQQAEQILLLLFAFISMGSLLSFSPLVLEQEKSFLSIDWILTIALYSLSCFIFAIVPFTHVVLLTPANFCIIGSFVSCALLFRSWRKPIEPGLRILLWSLLVVVGIIFETIREHGSFSDRVIFVMAVFSLTMTWQLYELARLSYVQGPAVLKLIFFFVLLGLILNITRAVSTFNTEFIRSSSIFNEEIFSRAIRWGTQAILMLTFFLIGTFYVQRQVYLRRQLVSSLSIKDTALSIEVAEKSQIQQLLNERETLIRSLILAKKTSEMGALSAALAHELNQPLGAMQLNAECLQLELINANPNMPLGQELVGRILSDNARASNIIVALKQIFSNTLSGTQRIDLATFIETLEELVLPLAKQEGITLEILHDLSGPFHVDINTPEFQQVILNLLNNSIQAFSGTAPDARRIQIELSKKNDRIYLAILDNGPGIDPSLQANIFNLLSTNKFAGMGLGLWLSQHIVERHQGRLWLGERPGWSTAFMIELPFSG